MTSFIGRRLLAVVPLLLLVTVVVFSLILLMPGDPAVALVGLENATEERLAAIRQRLGLDQPIYVQYARWLGRVVQGDLGTSVRTGQPVAEALLERVPVTLGLSLASTAVGLLIGCPLAVVAAYRRGGVVDLVARGTAALGVAVPTFWLGSMLALVLALQFRWLPATGYVSLFEDPWTSAWHMVLPTLTLAASAVAEVTRQLRSSLQDVLSSDYVRTARAKGLGEGWVVAKHALRNAMVPIVSIAALTVNRIIGATVVVESIFALPGLGRMNLESVLNRDFPTLQGAVLLMAIIVVAINLVSDLVYGWVDPRIRYS
ncbi:MAG: ABC transporter permease [Candidatus Rokubacteria bacterium]|nr:ABC transporter permease [Candidatus Rokubacteria bacterium]